MRPVSFLYGVTFVLLSVTRYCFSELGMSFIRQPEPFAAPIGDEVYFECSLNLAAEKFAWRHRPLNSDRWGELVLDEKRIGKVETKADNKSSKFLVAFDDISKAGDFQCIAYYGTSGLASDPARLSLATLEPFAYEKNQQILVAAGNTVPIHCPVPYSCPEPDIVFYKNDVIITNPLLTGGKTMVLENVTSSDDGNYYCEVNNYISSQIYRSKHNVSLSVYSDDKPQAPYFLRQPQSEYKVLPGKNITLECFGAGNPVPRVTWSRIDSHLPAKVRSMAAGLSIHNVQPSDRGDYHCNWQNRHGVKQYKIALRVMERPRVIKQLKVQTVSEGGDLELSCSVTGTPEPTVEWLINGMFLPKEHKKGSRLLVLSPVELRHAGIVQCVASNEYGSVSGYGLLRVSPKQHTSGTTESRVDYNTNTSIQPHTRYGGRRRPKDGKRKGNVLVPPNQPNVTRLSDVSVMVRWSVPENTGLPILFFKVQYRELGRKMTGKQAKWMTANTEIPAHVRSFEVTDLQPNRTYKFRIAAVYSNDDNKPSHDSAKFFLNSSSDFETNKMPIPLLTNTEALSSTEVLLLWQIEDTSVKIDGFYVYHRPTTSAGDYMKTTVEGATSTSTIISHLQPDIAYEFKVQSFSVDAASEFSQILKQKTLKVTTKPSVEPVPSKINRSENKSKPTENSQSNNSSHSIVGGALGGVAVLGVLAVVTIVYKRSKRKQNRANSQSQDKTVANGRVMNGGMADSKINITSNPLAGLDTSEDAIPKNRQPSTIEMASFLNGQNNNSHNNEDTTAGNTMGERSLPAAPANEQPL